MYKDLNIDFAHNVLAKNQKYIKNAIEGLRVF